MLHFGTDLARQIGTMPSLGGFVDVDPVDDTDGPTFEDFNLIDNLGDMLITSGGDAISAFATS